jgi:osmotically-inducible protein OsmY
MPGPIDPSERRDPRIRRGPAFGLVIAILAVLVVVGVALFVFVFNEPDRGINARGQVRGALSTVQDASENALTTSKVKAALALSKNVSAFDVNVDSNQGVITLYGEVATEQQKQLAEEITRQTSGVREVRNNLTVDAAARPDPEVERLGSRVADLDLRSRIVDRIGTDNQLSNRGINVNVQNQVVTLEGRVSSDEEKRAAASLAWQFDEVREVRNHLEVEGQAAGAESGDELARQVEFELYSSRAFDLQPINVRSEAGIVVLNGHVRSTAERVLAERIAGDVQGVTNVRNNLTVIPGVVDPERADVDQQPAQRAE